MTNANAINIFPNPAKDEITIQQTGTKVYHTAVLTNSIGENVLTIKLDKNSEIISLHNLMPGVYQVKFSGDKNTSLNRKIVVLK